MILAGTSILPGQTIHWPIPHDLSHSNNSNCRAYAMARAYGGNYCAGQIAYLGEPSSISGPQWENGITYSPANVGDGDIISWNNDPNGGEHVAYYKSKNGTNVYVDHKDGPSSPIQTNVLITSISGHGNPTHIIRKVAAWDFTVDNTFSGTTAGGTVKIDGSTYSVPKTISNVHWGSSHTLEAVLDEELYGGYRWYLDDWIRNNQGIGAANPIAVKITPASWSTPSDYEANYKKLFDVTMQNDFEGVGANGVIKVDGVQYTAPKTE